MKINLTLGSPYPYYGGMQLETLETELKPDRRAVAVAEAIYGATRPQRVILFGSRARGDHREDSDIDILIVTDEIPAEAHKEKVAAAARRWAADQYQWDAPVQLVWNTAEEFDRRRRTVNHLAARAMDEGVIMPEKPGAADAEENDYAYEWTVTEERVRHAEQHLDTFELLVAGGRSDRMIGKNAQEAMEHALKAVISACGARYERTHNLHRLLRQVNAAATGFHFTPRSNYRILMQYCGSDDYYTATEPLTDFPTYREDVTADVTALLQRAAQGNQPA